MRSSSSFFWNSILAGAASTLVFGGCANAAAPPAPAVDPYDSYYGQPTAQAQDVAPASGMVVNPSAPQQYTVKKGDTLWGVARKFLNTPWYWPEIWDKNQAIKNPHQIYPGDVLSLGYVDGGDGKLQPRIRVIQRGSGTPISSLAQFLVWPRVLDEATINSAPYLLASQDDHDLISEGETVYAKHVRNAQVGTRYAIFHPNKPLHDPQTGEMLGYEVTYGGYSRVERVGEPATLSILSAKREIRRADRLFHPEDETSALNAPIHAPAFKVRGQVIALFDAEAVSGNYMIATINRGHRDHIEVGHTVGIYAAGRSVADPVPVAKQPATVLLPPEKAADMVIYKVTDKVSYGLILDATREVRNGYKIGNP